MGALMELLLASLVLGWGLTELRSLRRYKREAEEKRREAEAERTGHLDAFWKYVFGLSGAR